MTWNVTVTDLKIPVESPRSSGDNDSPDSARSSERRRSTSPQLRPYRYHLLLLFVYTICNVKYLISFMCYDGNTQVVVVMLADNTKEINM